MSGKPAPGANLFELMFLIQDRMRHIVRDKDRNLSPVQILILRTLFETGEIPQHDLVGRLSRDKSQITRLLKDLEGKGMILRSQSRSDRRVHLVRAADHVRATIETFAAHEQALIAAMLDGATPDEIRALDAMLARMVSNLKSLATPG